MGWQEVSVEDQRREFVMLASLEGANDRSRRPLHSPRRLAASLEQKILRVRDAHPAWGARKIAAILRRSGIEPPAISSIHAVLRRHGRIMPGHPGRAYGTFEKKEPNALWQMDFKGQVRLGNGEWLHALTIIDDHSRFAIEVGACANQQTQTVQNRLELALRRHGLPEAIYVDNGSPWGGTGPGKWTPLRVWLLKLGIWTIYSTPYHPQGRGKNERFHRSLGAEVFDLVRLRDLAQAQVAFDRWRHVYNRQRPHQALDFATPAERYRPSTRAFPTMPPMPHYDEGEIVRRVDKTKGVISFRHRLWRTPEAFAGEIVAIRPRLPEGCFAICFGAYEIATIDLNDPETLE